MPTYVHKKLRTLKQVREKESFVIHQQTKTTRDELPYCLLRWAGFEFQSDFRINKSSSKIQTVWYVCSSYQDEGLL